MIDLIDRQELLRVIRNGNNFNLKCPAWVEDVIRNQPALQQWTSCAERTEDGGFLVTKRQKTGEIQVAIGSCYKGEWTGNGNFKDVIAWMPLPEPYVESEGDR